MRELKVLLIEDDEGLIQVVREAIEENCSKENCSLSLDTSITGVGIIDMHAKNRYNLMIVDLILPSGIHGLDIIREIRRVDKVVEFIIMSGHATVKNAIEAIALDVYYYMTKPFEMDELLSQSKKAIEHSILKSKILELAKLATSLSPTKT